MSMIMSREVNHRVNREDPRADSLSLGGLQREGLESRPNPPNSLKRTITWTGEPRVSLGALSCVEQADSRNLSAFRYALTDHKAMARSVFMLAMRESN